MPKFKKIGIIFLAVLITTAIFFRFWRIRDYVTFLGDEGRDMIVMRNIFTQHHLPFLGPTASVGGFYLGPIYYWMAAPFLLLWNFDPVGPSYMIAIFGVLTVVLLFKLLKESVGFWSAFLASFLYSTAPLIIRYSRTSWNPNPLPFFSLLLIYFLYLGLSKKQLKYFIGAGLCFGVAIQLHYLAAILLLISTAIIFLNSSFRSWPKIILASFAGFLITFSPFLFFEVRHNFPNTKTILEFVTRGSTVGYQHTNIFDKIKNAADRFLEFQTKIKTPIIRNSIFWLISALGVFTFLKNSKDSGKNLIISIGLIWFLGGIIGISLYQGAVYDYYYEFMYPAPFLLLGLIFGQLFLNKIGKILAILFTILTVIFFSFNGFYRTPPNKLINQTENIVDFVISKSNGKPYNFALISEHNSDQAYRYFLAIKNPKPTELADNITDQLLIICEEKKCAPLGHPLWEIAAFGRGEISGEWNLEKYGIKVFRLTHWAGAPNPAGHPATKQ